MSTLLAFAPSPGLPVLTAVPYLVRLQIMEQPTGREGLAIQAIVAERHSVNPLESVPPTQRTSSESAEMKVRIGLDSPALSDKDQGKVDTPVSPLDYVQNLDVKEHKSNAFKPENGDKTDPTKLLEIPWQYKWLALLCACAFPIGLNCECSQVVWA